MCCSQWEAAIKPMCCGGMRMPFKARAVLPAYVLSATQPHFAPISPVRPSRYQTKPASCPSHFCQMARVLR